MSSSVGNRLAFAILVSILGGALILLVAYNLLKINPIQQFSGQINQLTVTTSIKDVPSNAFGKLVANADTNAPTPDSAMSVSVGRGGDGQEVSRSSDGTDLISEPFAPYPIIQYQYTYAGENFNLDNVSDAVYKRTDGFDIGNAGNGLKQLKLGPVDLSKFRNTEVQSFGIMQSDKNGYTIYIDPTYGNISISGNEGIWGYTNGDYTPLTKEDRPSNEQAISTVNEFLADYGIDTQGFGQPIVDERDYFYALAQPEALRYMPESMNIIYPFLLDGQLTYGSDGEPQGLFVSLNLRTQKVGSINLNLARGYEKSSYALVRDVNQILDVAKRGGLYNYYPADADQTNVQIINIELGTPKIILVNQYIYSGDQSQTLFIPAASFPIIKNDDTYPVYQQNIVVPLVKDVLEDQANQPPIMYLEDTQAEVAN